MLRADGRRRGLGTPTTPALRARRQKSLRQFIVGDAVACEVGAIVCLLLFAMAEQTGYFLLQAGDLAICGLIVVLALRPAERDDEELAVTILCSVNWFLATFGAFLTPRVGTVMTLAAVIPVIFAMPYVSLTRLRHLMLGTVVSLVAIGILSRVQDVTRIDINIDPVVEDVVVIGCVTMIASLILLVVWQAYQELVQTNMTLYDLTADLTAQAEQLAESRSRLVAATDDARRRIERDLHDGAQQQLTALAVRLDLADMALADHPKAGAMLGGLAADLRSAIRDVRDLAHGIYPPLLGDAGLKLALPEAAARVGSSCSVGVCDVPRYATDVEVAVYFCCLEALNNAAKHAGPDAHTELNAVDTPEGLTVTITDNGPGLKSGAVGSGHGLRNMADRLAVVGGSLDVRSGPDHGTVVTITIPNPRPAS
ncbi:MAG: sensor histidine kinase [Marmoricola sp.]